MSSPVEGDNAALAPQLASLVQAVDGVAGLHGGALGGIGTYLPGKRITGIRLLDGGGADVHVTAAAGADLRAVADNIRRTVAAVVDGPVHVVIEDIDAP